MKKESTCPFCVVSQEVKDSRVVVRGGLAPELASRENLYKSNEDDLIRRQDKEQFYSAFRSIIEMIFEGVSISHIVEYSIHHKQLSPNASNLKAIEQFFSTKSYEHREKIMGLLVDQPILLKQLAEYSCNRSLENIKDPTILASKVLGRWMSGLATSLHLIGILTYWLYSQEKITESTEFFDMLSKQYPIMHQLAGYFLEDLIPVLIAQKARIEDNSDLSVFVLENGRSGLNVSWINQVLGSQYNAEEAIYRESQHIGCPALGHNSIKLLLNAYLQLLRIDLTLGKKSLALLVDAEYDYCIKTRS